MELSQEQLEELVVGKKRPPDVTFFESAVLDTVASREQGRRVYVTRLMVQRRHPGNTDYVTMVATEQDKRDYPHAYAQYKARGAQNNAPGISIIPGITTAQLQELRDLGLDRLDSLVAAESLPASVAMLQQPAAVLLHTLEALNGQSNLEKGRPEHSGSIEQRITAGSDRSGSKEGGPTQERERVPGSDQSQRKAGGVEKGQRERVTEGNKAVMFTLGGRFRHRVMW